MKNKRNKYFEIFTLKYSKVLKIEEISSLRNYYKFLNFKLANFYRLKSNINAYHLPTS